MASAFGHAAAALALGAAFNQRFKSWKFYLLGIACSIFPDTDVISFKLGIAYGDFWGHRGFTHSLLFALILGLAVTLIFYRNRLRRWTGLVYVLYFGLCTASHALLDAMTTGGLGVAFFSPWDNSRYFLPWRPIKISPIGVENFFSEWGKTVLVSEFYWIGIPSILFVILIWFLKKQTRIQKETNHLKL